MGRKFTRLTKKTAYPVIARYFSGNLSARDFCKKEGLSDDQFSLWRPRYMADHNISSPDPAPAAFHPIEVSPGKPSKAKDINIPIEMEYPNGVVLRFENMPEDSRLASLIKLY